MSIPHARSKAFFLGLVVPLLSVMWAGAGFSQSLSNSSSDPLSALQQQIQQRGGSSITADQPQPDVVLRPEQNLPTRPLPRSRLEEIISARAGANLRQIGYDQLGSGRNVTVSQTGAVQDDYVMGPGDEVVVSMRGQENSELRVVVNRNGQVVVPRLNPISASGRTFGSFRQDLETAIHRAYVATDGDISIGRVRQISVLVSGEVNNPGQRIVTGLSSVVDAILLSGGIKKSGSLRNVRIQRGGHVYTVDLYSVISAQGKGASLRLADGDRILVPLLGPTVAVTGWVRQPGIYELSARQSAISVRNLLQLAGGHEVRGNYRLSVLQTGADGRSSLNAVDSEKNLVQDSEILFVQPAADQTTSQVTLSGGTGLAGAYPIATGTSLVDVLRAPGALGDAPYTPFGIIVRKDPRTLLRQLVAFTPVAVLSGKENQALQSDDVIRPLQIGEAALLSNVVRAYLEKLAVDQSRLRNPLIDQGSSSITPVLPPNIETVTKATSYTPGLIPPSQTLPLSKVDEQSFALNDLTSAPPDVQRADIMALMDLRAPSTQAEGSPESLGEQQDQNGAMPASPEYVESRADKAAAAQITQQNNPLTSEAIPGSQPPQPKREFQPAQNFEESPARIGSFATNREVRTFGELVRQLGVDPLVLINFLMENRVRIDGAVRGPGSYFVGPNVELADLVQAAGGTLNWADDSGVELVTTAIDGTGQAITQRRTLPLRQASLVSYVVRPRDTLHFNQVFTDVGIGSVTLQGEVRETGSYPITRGEHLSELLARAGGLTNTAYPYGTVFLRKSAAQAEHDGYVRDAAEIQNELVEALTRIGNDKIDPSAFASLQVFVNELRNQKAVGRIAIEADPSILAAKPDLDPLLEAGDLVYIPQRPSTVSVLGQVAQPGSFPYRANRSVQDYIDLAGGSSAISDDDMTFVVLPNGSAHKVEKSWLSVSADDLPPGSTIVVPRDVTPLNTRQLILDISSIFSQFAVSIASMAVLAKQ